MKPRQYSAALVLCASGLGCAPPLEAVIREGKISVLASEEHLFALRPAMADPARVDFVLARQRDAPVVPMSLEGTTFAAAVLPADDYGDAVLFAERDWSTVRVSEGPLDAAQCDARLQPPCAIRRGAAQWNLLND